MEHKSDGERKEVYTISFAAYESAEQRWHRKLVAVFALLAFLIAVYVTAYSYNDNKWRATLTETEEKWKALFEEYDYTSSEVIVDGKEGNANYIGNDGVIHNGEDSSENANEDAEGRQVEGNARP